MTGSEDLNFAVYPERRLFSESVSSACTNNSFTIDAGKDLKMICCLQVTIAINQSDYSSLHALPRDTLFRVSFIECAGYERSIPELNRHYSLKPTTR